jgi:hypothetical protein
MALLGRLMDEVWLLGTAIEYVQLHSFTTKVCCRALEHYLCDLTASWVRSGYSSVLLCLTMLRNQCTCMLHHCCQAIGVHCSVHRV